MLRARQSTTLTSCSAFKAQNSPRHLVYSFLCLRRCGRSPVVDLHRIRIRGLASLLRGRLSLRLRIGGGVRVEVGRRRKDSISHLAGQPGWPRLFCSSNLVSLRRVQREFLAAWSNPLQKQRSQCERCVGISPGRDEERTVTMGLLLMSTEKSGREMGESNRRVMMKKTENILGGIYTFLLRTALRTMREPLTILLPHATHHVATKATPRPSPSSEET